MAPCAFKTWALFKWVSHTPQTVYMYLMYGMALKACLYSYLICMLLTSTGFLQKDHAKENNRA